MKRFLTSLLILAALSVVFPSKLEAQVQYYKTTAFAMKTKKANGAWDNWTDWKDSSMTLTIDLDEDVVKIYSPKKQVYKITKFVQTINEDNGGIQVEFEFIDQDGDRGHMRLRIEANKNSQLYVEYSNVIWVYNVKRI